MPPDNVWSYDKNEELVLDNLLNLDRPGMVCVCVCVLITIERT